MKIVQFESDNFKRLRAVQISPDGNVVTIGGKNGSGKSSILDAIYVALVGRSAAPPRPIRAGEETCRIKLHLGDIVVSRKFTAKEGGTYTDSLKVESADGAQVFKNPQRVLDELLGEIGFDPFAFVQMKPKDQTATLLGMVPLPVDLDELARMDAADMLARRDVNRDGEQRAARLAAIPAAPEGLPEEPVDRDAILAELAGAADKNTAIGAERARRDRERDAANEAIRASITKAERGRELIRQGEQLVAEATDDRNRANGVGADLDALPELEAPVDTAALQQRLAQAEATNAAIAREQQRKALAAEVEELRAKSKGYTDAMAARDAERKGALAKAKMPIEGLAFGLDEAGKAMVMFNGQPFEQASTAEQIRASTAIAMAANPQLRVLRIKDGSLLDSDSMAMVASMAEAEDFQLWVEVVAGDGVGIIMEDGAVKGAPEPEPQEEKPAKKAAAKKAAPAADKPEGGLL
jgi:energy-coupling factor transporter ATP-binding protein EcfA2